MPESSMERPPAMKHGCPVAVLWDIENCPPPYGSSVETISNNLRTLLRSHAYLEGPISMFSAYGDFARFSDRIRSGCQKAGVNLVNISRWKRDVAHKAILVDMFVFALDNPPPCNILLISGDLEFAPALHKLGRHGCNMMLVTSSVSAVLTRACGFVWPFSSVVHGDFSCIHKSDRAFNHPHYHSYDSGNLIANVQKYLAAPIPGSGDVSRQPLVPSSGDVSRHPLEPSSGDGSRYPLVPSSDDVSRHLMVPSSGDASRHPMAPSSGDVSRHPLVPLSGDVSRHPLVPSSGFAKIKKKVPRNNVGVSNGGNMRKSSVRPLEKHIKIAQRNASAANRKFRGIPGSDDVCKDLLGGFDISKIRVPRDTVQSSKGESSVMPPHDIQTQREITQRDMPIAGRGLGGIPAFNDVRKEPLVPSSGFDISKIKVPRDTVQSSKRESSMMPLDIQKHREIAQIDMQVADRGLGGIPAFKDVRKDPLVPYSGFDASKIKVPTDIACISRGESSVMPRNIQESRGIAQRDMQVADRGSLGIPPLNDIHKDPLVSFSGFDVSKIKVPTGIVWKIPPPDIEVHREMAQRDISVDNKGLGGIPSFSDRKDPLMPSSGFDFSKIKVLADIACSSSGDSSVMPPCNIQEHREIVQRYMPVADRGLGGVPAFDDARNDPLVPSGGLDISKLKVLADITCKSPEMSPEIERDREIAQRDMLLTNRALGGSPSFNDVHKDPVSGFHIKIQVPRDIACQTSVMPLPDNEKHTEIVQRDMPVVNRTLGGIATLNNACDNSLVSFSGFDIKVQVPNDIACGSRADNSCKSLLIPPHDFEEPKDIVLRDVSVTERSLRVIPGAYAVCKNPLLPSGGFGNSEMDVSKDLGCSSGGDGICMGPMMLLSQQNEIVQRDMSIADRAHRGNGDCQTNVDEDIVCIPTTVNFPEEPMVLSSFQTKSTRSAGKEKCKRKASSNLDTMWDGGVHKRDVKRTKMIKEQNIRRVNKKDVIIVSGFSKSFLFSALYMKQNRMQLRCRIGSLKNKRSVKHLSSK